MVSRKLNCLPITYVILVGHNNMRRVCFWKIFGLFVNYVVTDFCGVMPKSGGRAIINFA